MKIEYLFVFAGAFFLAYILLFALSCTRKTLLRTKAKKSGKKKKAKKPENPEKKKIGTMDIILVLIGVALLIFTVKMIDLFEQYQQIPDTLCTCVFGALGGECGIMGWIKTTKDRYQERKWEKEDQEKPDQ